MTNRRMWLAALCVAAAAVSFVATLAARLPRPPATDPVDTLPISSRDWQRATACDPGFPREARELSATLDRERAALADLLEDAASQDDQIRGQIERVIAAHNALERRVAEHVLKVRGQLTPEQQKQLMGLVSDTVRQAGPRWRGGRGEGSSAATQPTTHPGRRGKGR